MSVEVRLPQWGMGITEGTVIQWLKAVGDEVAEDEPIVEIETAKATDVVTAPVSGVLAEQSAAAGAAVPVGELLAIIDTGGS